MLGDSRKAQEVFQTTLREAALRAAHGELPNERFWLFREARWRCLEASETDLKAEPLEMEEHEINSGASSQIEGLNPRNWRSGFPVRQTLREPRSRFITSLSLITAKFLIWRNSS